MSYIVLCQGLWTGWDVGSHYILLCTRFNIWLHATPDSTAGEHKITDTLTMRCTQIQVQRTESLWSSWCRVAASITPERLCVLAIKWSELNQQIWDKTQSLQCSTTAEATWSTILLGYYMSICWCSWNCVHLSCIMATSYLHQTNFCPKKEKIKGTVYTDHLNFSILVSPHWPNHVCFTLVLDLLTLSVQRDKSLECEHIKIKFKFKLSLEVLIKCWRGKHWCLTNNS